MDIDEQLQLLQRQLMQVQEQKTNPLSERTVAEIMIKLYQQGFKFYATSDGNEYITPDKLDREIIQFVEQRGRTKIGVLPQLLNLNQDLIQSRLNGICQKSTHVRNNDTMLSKQYLRNFVHTLRQKLQIEGIVQLDQVAMGQEFNMPFLMKIITQNIADLDAEINGNQLVTQQYRRMNKRRILGFLNAVTRPVLIQQVFKGIRLYDSNTQVLIEELIGEGKLKGRYQNSYYIPDKFSQNQKEMVSRFYQNNGYLDYKMLQKNFQISKPQQWLKKNLPNPNSYTIFQQICFNKAKLESYQSQINSLLKGQGFFQISNVIPFQLDDTKMEKFLMEVCEVKDFVLEEGVCYSEEWLGKSVNEFRDRVVYDIFFRKGEPKGKKKGGKKQKEPTLTQQEIVQTLFDAGLAQYSVAQNLAPSLLPLITQRLQTLKTQLQKQLTQSQGIITNAFLKYKKCKTIIKTPQNLQRVLNTIEKQKKKGGEWIDPDFGPNENNPQGKYSLIYYDGVVPKEWPGIQNVKWNPVGYREIVGAQCEKSKFMSKSLLTNILEIIDHYNAIQKQVVIPTPNFTKLPTKIQQGQQQPTSPFVFKFFLSQKQSRFVLIDNLIPFINQQMVSSTGLYGLIQKSYAKLRYCYKSILNLSLHQLLLQLTGLQPIKLTNQSPKDQEKLLYELTQHHIVGKNLVIVMGEGVGGKKLKVEGEETEFVAMRPYLLSEVTQGQEEEEMGRRMRVWPGDAVVESKMVVKVFKNIYILGGK